uniref:Small subunit ribosomal protein S10 n=1 Tax=Tetraselmis sp. GSL018 TaxID=582737 RepID=A0A061SBJ1_9CHLO|mmetsp:Transcript_13098/g.31050  ORF Transcript_13098/g.31050 Transcript_13098/m.31050 type:complete len:148 (+) Transcript_13098:81-524(+)
MAGLLKSCSLNLSSARMAPSPLRATGATRAALPRAQARPTLAASAAPDTKIRIKLKSYEVGLLKDSVEMIKSAVDSTGASMSGPVNMPTRIRRYCVLRSPHVNKKSREHFESRTHSRLMDIKEASAQTIDKLMSLDLPAGVDVQVKL